jgi:predicted DNA-binding transcriptional regulator YafY
MADLSILTFRYRDGSSEDARVIAHPYALVIHGGAMTCVARDLARGVTQAFAFDRMSELAAGEGGHFELPADFNIADWIQGDFGLARAARSVKLMVEFESRAAELVRMRRVHPSQKVGVAPDGRVRLSLTIPEAPEVLAEVRSWILGFGAAARVLEPRELADEIASELRLAADRYESAR